VIQTKPNREPGEHLKKIQARIIDDRLIIDALTRSAKDVFETILTAQERAGLDPLLSALDVVTICIYRPLVDFFQRDNQTLWHDDLPSWLLHPLVDADLVTVRFLDEEPVPMRIRQAQLYLADDRDPWWWQHVEERAFDVEIAERLVIYCGLPFSGYTVRTD
jgi:hypothetical protein